MIGSSITDEKGQVLEGYKSLSKSVYQPNEEVTKLYMRVQQDYGLAWRLQHRAFDEFDAVSLLQRAKLDQQTFGAFVGATYLPAHKKWRWKGRKNTARNKLIGLLAHMLAAMLFPTVFAQNDDNEEDKTTARVMKILIEEHLRKAQYESRFLYMTLSALVNPAVFVHLEYVEMFQRIKRKLSDGTIEVVEAIDELMSGIQLNIIPIDEILLADFYTNDIQRQPYVIRVRRIPWDEARKIYGNHPDFQYVLAGKTRIVLAGQEHQTLFDIEWTEADRNYVQELTAYYRAEDLEVCFVGGVFMGTDVNPMNSNPFTHRRMTLFQNEYMTMPVYPFAKSYYEPADPTGRFAYGKSGAAKEYWDDATQNKMHQLMVDGTYLDVIKPLFFSGVANIDSTVIAPGATVGMPANAQVKPYELGPNLSAAMNTMSKQEGDMSDSTLSTIMQGQLGPRQTAFAVNAAMTNAKVMLGLFSAMMADLVRQIGELTVDCIIQHTTVGELDATIPGALNMKYHTILAKTKESGKDVTNRIEFTSAFMGRDMTEEQIKEYEWNLYKLGGDKPIPDQYVYHVNPYKFARTRFSMVVDADQIVMRASGNMKQNVIQRHQMLTDQFVYPFTDPQAVANDIIEEFSDGDPDKFKKRAEAQNQMMNAVMGDPAGKVPGAPGAPQARSAVSPMQPQQGTGMPLA